MTYVKRLFLATLTACSLPVWAGGDASDGHSHAAPAPLPVTQSAAPRAAATTEEFELVATLEGNTLVVYLDRFASNEVVAKATVEIEGAGLKGVASETTPGTYVLNLSHPLPQARHLLTISVEAGDAADLLTATLDTSVSAGGVGPTRGWSQWNGWGFWVLAGGLLLVAGIVFAVRRRMIRSTLSTPLNVLAMVLMLAMVSGNALAHGDEDHSKDAKQVPAVTAPGAATVATAPQRLADGSLFIPKPVQRQLGLRTQPVHMAELAATVELNGRVIPDPETGGRVQAMFTGSVIPGPKGMPTAGRRVAKGEVLAYLRPISGAIERGNQKASLAELEAQLAIAEGKKKRFEQLEGAVPQKEIEAARIEYAALQQRRAYVRASIDSTEALVAPAAGIISASHHLLAGQVVDAKEVLFEIVDPARLAVEALAYDVGIAATLISATALAEQTALDLTFVGGGRQLREQALPLLFRIVGANSMVAVGQPVKVIVRTAHELKGIALPRAALTRVGAGETAVWVHTEAERFVARRIRHQSLDAVNIAILDGLQDGDRVVTVGAGLLSQVR